MLDTLAARGRSAAGAGGDSRADARFDRLSAVRARAPGRASGTAGAGGAVPDRRRPACGLLRAPLREATSAPVAARRAGTGPRSRCRRSGRSTASCGRTASRARCCRWSARWPSPPRPRPAATPASPGGRARRCSAGCSRRWFAPPSPTPSTTAGCGSWCGGRRRNTRSAETGRQAPPAAGADRWPARGAARGGHFAVRRQRHRAAACRAPITRTACARCWSR